MYCRIWSLYRAFAWRLGRQHIPYCRQPGSITFLLFHRSYSRGRRCAFPILARCYPSTTGSLPTLLQDIIAAPLAAFARGRRFPLPLSRGERGRGAWRMPPHTPAYYHTRTAGPSVPTYAIHYLALNLVACLITAPWRGCETAFVRALRTRCYAPRTPRTPHFAPSPGSPLANIQHLSFMPMPVFCLL